MYAAQYGRTNALAHKKHSSSRAKVHRVRFRVDTADGSLVCRALVDSERLALQQQLDDSYWVVAEVSDLTLPRFAGAHCYLTLTEQTTDGRSTPLKAQARATLWSQRYQQLAPAFERATGQPLRPGLKLLLRVQVRFHEQYGLSLDVAAIDPSYTVGELALLRLATLRRL